MNFGFQLCLILAFQFLGTFGLPLVRRNNVGTADGFVSVTSGGDFQLNGEFFRFYGTNAYWAQMTTDDDLDRTFHDISTAGFKVVRTWAFNDVASKPDSGTYFQILSDGKATINTGADGLQRLDQVVATATKYGLKLVLTLTNNWNPEKTEPRVAWDRRDNDGFPRGYLSNDYGGMDLYVRAFQPGGTHDLFYTDDNIVNAFKTYITAVVTRYASNPTVLAWELGNDLRCSSTVSASSSCNPQVITKWAADISSCIKKLDSKHLITPGDTGFYCLGCPKLYAWASTDAAPALVGPSFDGSYGIDTEDLISIPTIDFGSFQILPEQTVLFPASTLPFATKAIGDGGKWVQVHSNSATLLRKPEVLLAVGIVNKANWQFFVPNSGTAPPPEGAPCEGVENFQQDYAFTAWGSASLNGKIGGMLEYQWLELGLTSHGTTNIRRQMSTSPQDGYTGNYNGPASGQNAAQFSAALNPIS